MAETVLDLIGLKCPLPVLRTGKALKALPVGDVLVVSASDPLAAVDIPNLVRETGDRLIGQERADEVLTFTILRA